VSGADVEPKIRIQATPGLASFMNPIPIVLPEVKKLKLTMMD
jgi:hypothetical protein